jgi:D-alanyl-D-alanine dipeptidase
MEVLRQVQSDPVRVICQRKLPISDMEILRISTLGHSGQEALVSLLRGPDGGVRIRRKNYEQILEDKELGLEPVVFGRGMESLPLSNECASVRHCSVELADDGEIVLKDLRSSNGTFFSYEQQVLDWDVIKGLAKTCGTLISLSSAIGLAAVLVIGESLDLLDKSKSTSIGTIEVASLESEPTPAVVATEQISEPKSAPKTSRKAISAAQETSSGLTNVAELVPDLIVLKPYATADNFTREVVYPSDNETLTSVCEMEAGAALKVQKADAYLEAHSDGSRLVAWDCLRPDWAQTILRTAWGCDINPGKCDGYIAKKSKHSFGKAFDGTLADKNGVPLEMPTRYDDFSQKAHLASHDSWSAAAQINADLYKAALEAAGCTINKSEWWHGDCDKR